MIVQSPAPPPLQILLRLSEILSAVERSTNSGAESTPIYGSDSNQAIGAVYGEDGKICWAQAEGASLGMRDLLTTSTSVSEADLDRVMSECHERGEAVSDRLLDLGLVSRKNLLYSLRRQIASALMELALGLGTTPATAGKQVPLEKPIYSSSLAFTAVELILEAMTLGSWPTSPSLAPPALYQQFATEVEVAISFVETGDSDHRAIPVAYRGAKPLRLREALKVYRSVRSVISPVMMSSDPDDDQKSVIVHSGHQGWLVTGDQPHISVFRVGDWAQFGALISALNKVNQQRKVDRRGRRSFLAPSSRIATGSA